MIHNQGHGSLAKKCSLVWKLPYKYHRRIPNAKAVFEAVNKSVTEYIRKCMGSQTENAEKQT